MFFDSQPNFYYPYKNGLKISKNLFRRIRFRDNLNALYVNSIRYTVLEGETPETIAQKQYGSTDWYWTILLLNNIIDVNNDWPVPADDLDESVEKKYGNKADNPRHWETKEVKTSGGIKVLDSGVIIELYQGTTAQQNSNYYPSYSFKYLDGTTEYTLTGSQVMTKITNREFEYRENEKKKEIYLIKNRFLPMLESEIEKLFAYDTEYKIDNQGIRFSET